MKSENTTPRKRSSWQAAIAQLPGFPAEEKPRLPETEAAARQVSALDEEAEPQ
jgi:hypothetical protein